MALYRLHTQTKYASFELKYLINTSYPTLVRILSMATSTQNTLESSLHEPGFSWDISSFDLADLPKGIRSIEFCAHPCKDNAEQSLVSSNRWTLLLKTDFNHAVSIELHAASQTPNTACTVVVRTRKYPVDEYDYRLAVQVHPPPGYAVEDVLHLLTSLGRDRYRLNAYGQGHRYWMHKVSCDMHDAGLFSWAVVCKLYTALSRYWKTPANKGSEPARLRAGEFY